MHGRVKVKVKAIPKLQHKAFPPSTTPSHVAKGRGIGTLRGYQWLLLAVPGQSGVPNSSAVRYSGGLQAPA